MNTLTEQISTLLHPRAALIAYSTESNSGGYFLELRPIGDDGKMGEAMPVTFDFMNDIARNYSEAHSGTPFGVVPHNLLYADTRKGSEKYIWYNAPCRRMMYFRASLGIENTEYNLPGILYIATDSTLEVYAYKGDKPDEQSDLFAAPYFNVTETRVCLGSSKISKPSNPTYAELLTYWEKRFWLTEFTHLGGGGNPTRSNLVLVTKAARNEPFNLEELKPMKKTLQNILR